MNFSFEVGRRIIDQGLLPHRISTDLTVPGRLRTVHSMTEMMPAFLGLGFTLAQVVTMCTANPAKAIGAAHRLGSLATGRQADISVLELREGDWVVHDVLGASLRVTQAVVPFFTVKRGQVFTPDWGAAALGLGARPRPPGGGDDARLLLTGPAEARLPARPCLPRERSVTPASCRRRISGAPELIRLCLDPGVVTSG